MRTDLNDDVLTELAVNARDGSPADLEAFVLAAYPCVRRFVAYLTDPQSAEDLTQETFLRVIGSLRTFAARSSARSWLLSIARRVVIDRFRSAAVRPAVADLPDWQAVVERRRHGSTPSPENAVVLADLLTRVPGERRAAFVLTQLVGLPYTEAADVLGCPVGTIRSRVARARLQLVTSVLEADRAA
ncbi:sigma-70 family RNA polymerase sigma factor [Nonomuraea typhae]|uniref:sigma-70 family RNA polymerase sigma factor n=1 Tax=Nonomuraea typhae TaxID=2603600 RepID=UPI0012F84200|nr:sigma-70 family RNA polymerase sigma factor [Nonomuraea typhae]